MTNRREFIVQFGLGSGVLASGSAFAAAAEAGPLSEKDVTAVALGYVADAAKADAKKYPKYAADQKCANCQLYTGAKDAANGPCAVFGQKLVPAKAWCSSWVKKA
ncbi:MAG: high-potential iron-sulfur protein [Comamonadaceae bacterium]